MNKFKGNYRLSSDDSELVIPSIFVDEDRNRHMSINLDTGLWRCFKTQTSGNFIKIYSVMENIPYKRAYEEYVFSSFINEDTTKPEPRKVEVKRDFTEQFFELEDSDTKILKFLESRKLLGKYKFLKCNDAPFLNRVIIPFYEHSDRVFYYQARALDNYIQPKYLNCKHANSSNILLPFDYESSEPLYVTEGVFDALSIRALGVNATTTLSAYVSKAQMEQLKFYKGKIVVAYDSDEAGIKGSRNFLRAAYRNKLYVSYSRPPKPFKDWNEWYCSGQCTKDALIDGISDLNDISLSLSSL